LALTIRDLELTDREPVLISSRYSPSHITARAGSYALGPWLGNVCGANGTSILADKEDKRSEPEGRNSGQVRHDDRGNAVWHWATDTARTAMASTSQLLRKLDLTGLSLESDQPAETDEPKLRSKSKPDGVPSKPVSAALSSAPGVAGKKRTVDSRSGGFDPYSTNAGAAKRGARGAAEKVASAAKAAAAPAANATRRAEATAPPRASWWRRLLRRD
jgi:hypothetical protein